MHITIFPSHRFGAFLSDLSSKVAEELGGIGGFDPALEQPAVGETTFFMNLGPSNHLYLGIYALATTFFNKYLGPSNHLF